MSPCGSDIPNIPNCHSSRRSKPGWESVLRSRCCRLDYRSKRGCVTTPDKLFAASWPCAPVTKQYNLVDGRWCSVDGKVTVGLHRAGHALSPVHTSNNVEATLSNATKSNVASTKSCRFWQQCRSNVRLCCQKRQQCRTSFALKFRPFDKVECCFDKAERCFNIVAGVDRALDYCLSTYKLKAYDREMGIAPFTFTFKPTPPCQLKCRPNWQWRADYTKWPNFIMTGALWSPYKRKISRRVNAMSAICHADNLSVKISRKRLPTCAVHDDTRGPLFFLHHRLFPISSVISDIFENLRMKLRENATTPVNRLQWPGHLSS